VTESTATAFPLPIPSPVPLVEQPDGTKNLVLLGADESTEGTLGRTDVMVVVTIFTDPPSVSLLSIPRDLYVWIPDVGFDRINMAYRRGVQNNHPDGGPGLVRETIEYNLGITIHRWVQVDFDGFRAVVDALGGVEVAVECPLGDTFPDPDAESGHTDVDWLPGMYRLDGRHALWYVRSRWSTNDLDRNRRQQQVLRGIYDRVMTLGVIPRIPELWGLLNEYVSTDMNLEELVRLGTIGTQVEPSDVRSILIGRGVVRNWLAPNGAQVLVAYDDALAAVVGIAVKPPSEDRASQPPSTIQVWNATGDEGLGYVAVERLRLEGFHVAGPNLIEGQYPRTLLFDFTTSPKGSALPLLLRLYGLPAERITYEPTAERAADYGLVLGVDYDPCLATQASWWPEDLPTPTPLP
jgi:LCP family protein required for cell wall assembly